jgi:polyisoprenoid-binding protein YceI
MKKSFFIAALVMMSITAVNAQKFISKSGHIWFFSSTPMENIEAHNRQASGVIDAETGNVLVNVLMKSFEFEKALMQEHFNENYVESDKFPKAKFAGKIVEKSAVDFKNNGEYKVTVNGELTIHGVTKEIESPFQISVKEGKIQVNGKLVISPEDYGISIPSVVRNNIAKTIDINVDMGFEPATK